MIKFKTLEVSGFKPAFKGMRNPKNSWGMSDSYREYNCNTENYDYIIGEKDLRLAQTLIKAGGEHRKFLRQIQVWVDIDEPRYFWSEADTYKFNTKNSCSTMHKLLTKDNPITLDMFLICEEDIDVAEILIKRLNDIREVWLNSKDQKVKDRCLLRAKRLLMEGFLQLRTVNTNYEELRNMYHQRKNHRLKEEWVDSFCGWVSTLPYAQELIMS